MEVEELLPEKASMEGIVNLLTIFNENTVNKIDFQLFWLILRLETSKRTVK